MRKTLGLALLCVLVGCSKQVEVVWGATSRSSSDREIMDCLQQLAEDKGEIGRIALANCSEELRRISPTCIPTVDWSQVEKIEVLRTGYGQSLEVSFKVTTRNGVVRRGTLGMRPKGLFALVPVGFTWRDENTRDLKVVPPAAKSGKREGVFTHERANGGKSEGTYKNGKKEGVWTGWYGNGQKESELTYKNGKREGVWTSWHENGQKKSEGTCKNDKPASSLGMPGGLHGVWTYWHDNGQKESEGSYKYNFREGVWTSWHENGQKESEGAYKLNWKEGIWTFYDKQGNATKTETYKGGELVK